VVFTVSDVSEPGSGVGVAVGVAVGVSVGVGVGVALGVGVAVDVGVAVGVGDDVQVGSADGLDDGDGLVAGATAPGNRSFIATADESLLPSEGIPHAVSTVLSHE
jgi:hypothetical protein